MKFLQGTYGFDLFSLFLFLLGNLFIISRYTNLLGLALIIYSIYRAFSKNIYRRTSELNKFITIANKILSKFEKKIPNYIPKLDLETIPILLKYFKANLEYKRKYKITKCKKCQQKLRLPRDKGTIIVTCKKCNNEFRLKT